MADVLPKPFTKDGMLRALEKHLPQFRKNARFPPGSGPMQQNAFVTGAQAPLGLNMAQLSAASAIKEESPGKPSPASATWQPSPNQIPGSSPINPQGYMQPNAAYALTPTHANHPQFPPNPQMTVPRGPPQQHRRVMSDMTGGPEPSEHPDVKRQRMYAPPPGNFPQ